jgi:hypothetical protein
MDLVVNPDRTGPQDSSRLQQLWEVALLGNSGTPAPPYPRVSMEGAEVSDVAAVSGNLAAGARSAQDGLAVVQTADNALGDVAALLKRMDLIAALCGATAGLSSTAQTALQNKFEDLQAEVKRLQADASWKGVDVLAGHDLTFKSGPGAEDSVTLDGATTLTPVDVSQASVTDPSTVQNAIDDVDSKRADLATAKDRLIDGLRAPGTAEQTASVAYAPEAESPGSNLSLLL